jgi:hypothetical protein
MKSKDYLYFYIFLLTIFFFFILFFKVLNINLQEPLTEKDTIVLIGDSILNNDMFVPRGNSVEDKIKENHGKNLIICAKDGATIESCYYQLKLHEDDILDDENYHLFISVGGNDILNNDYDESNIEKLFKKYEELIDFIKKNYSKTHIYLFNLYFPANEKYKKYKKTTIKWNEKISSLSSKYKILRLDNVLIDEKDFTYEIEPSTIGSEKIAEIILKQ